MSFAEDAITYAYEATRPFTLKQCVRDIASDGKYTERRADLVVGGLADHPNLFEDCKYTKRAADLVAEGLAEDPSLFEKEPLHYVPRHHLFADARFRVCPLAAELQEGVLYPGHRFIPFCHPDAPIDELTLLDADDDPIVYKVVEASVEDVVIYHNLIPLSKIPFLVPDEESAPLSRVWLNALDLAAWYAKHGFQEGDAILITVLDLNQGIYRIEHSPLEDIQRNFSEIRRSDVALEEALLRVIEESTPDALIETQLFHAHAQADPRILQNPGNHIGAVLSNSEGLTWTNDGHVCCLHAPGASPQDGLLMQAIDDLPVPTGKGKSVAAIIEDLGIATSITEIRAMIRQAATRTKGQGNAAQTQARHEVLDELFPYGAAHFVNRKQADAFFRDFDRLWDKVAREESRHPSPLPLARLRGLVLAAKADIRRLLRDIDGAKVQITDLPGEEMIALSEIDTMLTGFLDAIEVDASACEPDSDLFRQISALQDEVRGFVSEIRQHLGLQ